jgi:hypothetical protein
MYNIDIEIIGHYNIHTELRDEHDRPNFDEVDTSTRSITTLGDASISSLGDDDLEDPLPAVPLEINLTPVNSETQENNIINDIVDIKDILIRFEEEENNNI